MKEEPGVNNPVSMVIQDGTQVAMGQQGPWGKKDRQWFKRHGKRSHRLRRAFPGEPPPGEGSTASLYAVIRQEAVGVRKKYFLTWLGDPDYLSHDEARLHAVFDMLDKGLVAEGWFTDEQIEAAAAPLREAWMKVQ